MYTRDDCPLSPGSAIYAYLRVSGDDQAERGTPIAGQRYELQSYIEKHHLILAHPAFVDEARPGSSTAGRAAFLAMIRQARSDGHHADGIVFWSWSRFARDADDAHFYKADLRRRGFTVWSLTDDVPEGDLQWVFEALIHWKDAQLLQQISRDAKRGLHLLAQRGYAPGGKPPRGYQSETLEIEIEGKRKTVRRWILDPNTADLVRLAWRLRAQGKSLQEILDATHIYKSKGCYASFFGNETYLGIRKCGDLRIDNAHEPLVDRETWDIVQAKRIPRKTSRKGKTWTHDHPRRASSPHLLSGLFYCHCGAAMIGCRDKPRSHPDGYHRNAWRFYICGRKKREGYSSCSSTKIKAELVEKAVLDNVLGEILTVDNLTRLLDEANRILNQQLPDDLHTRQQALQSQIDANRRSIDRLLDALERTGFSEAIQGRLTEREAEREALQTELRLIGAQLQLSDLSIDRDQLLQIIQEKQQSLCSDDIPAARTVLASFVERINLKETGRDAIIQYAFPFGEASTVL